jgi:hypothetical protein
MKTNANSGAGFFVEAEEKKRRRCGPSSRFFDNGIGEKTSRKKQLFSYDA